MVYPLECWWSSQCSSNTHPLDWEPAQLPSLDNAAAIQKNPIAIDNGNVRTNLIARVSQIQGHEIRIVLYARLDGDFRLYEADYVVYILMRLPLISQCFISAPDA